MKQDRTTNLTVDDVKEEKILKAKKPEDFASGRSAFSPRIKRDKTLAR